MSHQWRERADPRDRSRLTHDEFEHLARYRWAAGLLSGDVLDAACGTGFGSAILAGGGARVVGIDRDGPAVAIARRRAPGARFEVAPIPPLPFGDAGFDGAVSFETLEHIADDAGFLSELHRVLRPGGRLLLSTPNRAMSSPNLPRPPNPFHVREYLLPELLALIEATGFGDIAVHCQRPERRRLPEYAAMAVVARLPRLCRPGRWWDDLAHGTGAVTPWSAAITHPLSWVIAARRP
jgi:SAM-dependent methyltransferase